MGVSLNPVFSDPALFLPKFLEPKIGPREGTGFSPVTGSDSVHLINAGFYISIDFDRYIFGSGSPWIVI